MNKNYTKYISGVCLALLVGIFQVTFAQQTRVVVNNGHTGHINALVYSPNGKYLLAGTEFGKVVRLWETNSGKLVGVFPQQGLITQQSFSADSRKFLTIRNKKVMVWNTATAQLEASIKGPGRYYNLRGAFFLKDTSKIVVYTPDKTKLWSLQRKEWIADYSLPSSYIKQIALSQDRAKMVCFGNNQVMTIRNIADNRIIKKFKVGYRSISNLALSNDLTKLIIIPDGKSAEVWHLPTQTLLHTLGEKDNRNDHVVFSPDGSELLTSSIAPTTRIWKPNIGKLKYTFEWGRIAAYSSNGKYLAVYNKKKGLEIYDATSKKKLKSLKVMAGKRISKIVFDGNASNGGLSGIYRGIGYNRQRWVKTLNLQQGIMKITPLKFPDPKAYNFELNFSPNAQQVIYFNWGKRKIAFLNAQTGQVTKIFNRFPVPIKHATFPYALSANQQLLAVKLQNKQVVILNAKTGQIVQRMSGFELSCGASCLALSKDGARLIIEDKEQVQYWDVKTGQMINAIPNPHACGYPAAISPDGRSGVVLLGTYQLYDLTKGTLTKKEKNNMSIAQAALKFSPNGKLILHKSSHQINVLNSKLEPQYLLKSDAKIKDCRFSQDGKWIIGSLADGAIKVWETSKGQLIGTLYNNFADEKAWVFTTSNGRYDASNEGLKYLHQVSNTGKVTALLVNDPKRQKDLLQKVFGK
mgnify:CR=1 FL=1